MIKAVVNGLLKLESPLLISSGENLQSDQDFVLDSQGRPFIPGTSLTGSLRNEVCKYFRANLIFNKDELEDILALFWGREEILLQKDINNRNQSSVIISNCYLENVSEIPIPIRDGIKIDNRIGIA
jgi:CRISPR/Cas system CSM-associated protein Csm3 (group 7 of RAMP superfamily)